METKLTKEEIAFLDMLCERWERRVAQNNRKFLSVFYKEFKLQPPKLESYGVIPFEMLKEDIGKKFFPSTRVELGLSSFFPYVNGELSKKFLNRTWELFLFIYEYFNDYQPRLQLTGGTIVIMHPSGQQKSMVLSIMQKGKSWTYKMYRTGFSFREELESREKYNKFVPLTKQFVARRRGIATFPITKEEYGGATFNSLISVANDKEKEKIYEILKRHPFLAHSSSMTYNPKTKKIYVVDLGD